MFWHNFKYSFKTLLRSKALVFWTFAFPLILGTFFYMAFSDIENSEKFKVFDIAVVNTEEFINNEMYQEVFKSLSNPDTEQQLFNVKNVSVDEAKELLENKEIVGYVLLEDKPKVVVGSSGADETVLKYVVEEIVEQEKIVSNLVEADIEEAYATGNLNIDYNLIYQEAIELLNTKTANIVETQNSNLSYTMIEFYTLIAMTCLYGGLLGMVSINNSLANISSRGKRVAVSPTSKGKIICSSVLASYIIQVIGLFLLFIYTIFVLKVDYGNNLPLIILLALVGSMAGLALGIFIATLFKANENVKTGILIAVTMLGCWLSGMMGITMKYVVDSNAPIINKINPANMITDGFYALYYYDTLDRYWLNIISLLIFSGVLVLLSLNFLRRQKYDSI